MTIRFLSVFLASSVALPIMASASNTTQSAPGPFGEEPAAFACRVVTDGKDIDTAIAACNTLLQRSDLGKDDLVPTLIARGLDYALKGKADLGLADLNKAISLSPDEAQAYYFRGLVFKDARNFDAALADFSKALGLKPDAATYLARGKIYAARRDFAKAYSDFDQAVSLASDKPEAYFERGKTALTQGDLDRVQSDYEQAASLAPDNFSIQLERVYYYLDRGMVDQARPIAEHLATIGGDDPAIAYVNGRLADLMGDYKKEMADATAAVDMARKRPINGELIFYYTNRALIYELAGRSHDADTDMSAAIKLDAHDSIALDIHCLILGRRKALAEATPVCEEAIKSEDSPEYAYDSHAYLHMHQGHWQEALADLNKAIDINPAVAGFYFDRAFIAEHLGDKAAADRDYAKARSINRHVDIDEYPYGIIPGVHELVPHNQVSAN